jgi:DnaK suppressor protein
MTTQVTTITEAETRRRKAALEAKLKELVSAFPDREELQSEYLADPLDQIRSNIDRDMVIRRLDHQTQLIHDLRSALVRIEVGDYAVCEQCEEPIPRKRLDAVPWARRCVACQSQAEAGGQGGKMIFQDAA